MMLVMLMSISRKLLSAMHSKKISTRALSEMTGIPKSAIQRYTSGDTEKIPADRLAKMADCLGVPLSALADDIVPRRIVALCNTRGINLDELAARTGVDRRIIDTITKPGALPSTSLLARISEVLGVSVDYLLGREDVDGPRLPSNVRSIQSLHRQVIPVIGEVAAGEPIYAPEELGVYVDSPVDADAAMTVKGDSMSPGYQDGDIVYIKCRPDVQEGMIAVVFLDDEAVIKRVYKRQTGLTLASDNPAYPPIMAEFEDYTNMRIFGMPVGYTRIYKNRIDGKIKKGMV